MTISLLNKAGIAFPATQVPNADPNTFDDYEEGTWTPLYKPATGDDFTSVTLGISKAVYTKLGRLVTCILVYRTDAINKGTATAGASVDMSGLPFVASSTVAPDAHTPVAVGTAFLVNNPSGIRIAANAAVAGLKKDFDNASILVSDLNTGSADNFIALTFSYYSN